MKSKILRGLRSLAAVLAGFVVIGVGTILTFEVVLGGIGFYKSSPTELVIGALIAGYLVQTKGRSRKTSPEPG